MFPEASSTKSLEASYNTCFFNAAQKVLPRYGILIAKWIAAVVQLKRLQQNPQKERAVIMFTSLDSVALHYVQNGHQNAVFYISMLCVITESLKSKNKLGAFVHRLRA